MYDSIVPFFSECVYPGTFSDENPAALYFENLTQPVRLIEKIPK